MSRPRFRRPRGLTLIEIAVAICILAVIATLAAPSLRERIARQRLVSAAEMLSLDLAEARVEAVRSGQELHVVFDRRADWCYAVARTPGCACGEPAACQLKVVRAADTPGVSVAEAEDAHFDVSGTSAEGAKILLRGGADGAEGLRVGLSPLGRPTVCTTTGVRGYPGC